MDHQDRKICFRKEVALQRERNVSREKFYGTQLRTRNMLSAL